MATAHPLMTEAQAADYLAVSVKSLQAWRFSGQGPEFIRLGGGRHGAIRYTVEALGAYIERRTLKNTGQRAA